jgi:ankyrin repeat protein
MTGFSAKIRINCQLLFFSFFAVIAATLLFTKAAHSVMPVPVIRGKEPLPADQISQIKLLDVFADKQELLRQSHGHGDLETIITPVEPKQSAQDIQGQFIVALGNDDIQEAQRFLNQGADINSAVTQTGQTPLMFAESRAMAELLVKKGADIKTTDLKGGSVLHYAVTRKDAVALIQFFTTNGVDPNLRSWLTEPAIFIACQYFHETRAFDNANLSAGQNGKNAAMGPAPRATLAALVNGGADINIRDDVGNTLLMSAVTWDNRNLVLLLLALGADKNLDKDGRTAKDMAYDMGHRGIYQVLE